MSSHDKKNPFGTWENLAKSEANALDAMWQTRQEWFEGQKAGMNSWYDRLGWIGKAFRQAFESAACVETIDSVRATLSANTRAVANGHNVFDGFMNAILIGRGALADENPYALFSALNHERTHLAIQYRNVAASHATPWNSKAHVVLCPRDAMILNVLMERQAFAVQRVFEDLARGMDEGELGPQNMPSHEELQAVLHIYTKEIDWHVKWDTDEAFVRHYRDQAQDFYTGGHAAYLKRSDITFARLGIEDLRAINDFFGLNTFGNSDDELLQLLTESFEGYQLEKLAGQNADLCVPAYELLPSVTEALQKRKMSSADFIRLSLGEFAFPAKPNMAAGQSAVPVFDPNKIVQTDQLPIPL